MGFTHRLFLKDGHTFMTNEDRALMQQIKEDALQSAATAADEAAKAQEYAISIDPERIDANVAAKADNLYYDSGANMLYLTSNGSIVGDGVPVSTTGGGGNSANNAVLTLQNTTGWTYKNVSQSSGCKLSFTWSSLEDGVSTGPGAMTVKVGGVLRHSAQVDQGPVEIDVSNFLSTGSNAIRVGVSDVYGNSRTIAFTINVITLTLASSFDPNIAYTGSIAFPYVPTGAIEKTVHFVLDGVEIGHTVTSISGRQQSFTIPAQAHGSHTFHVYFDAVIDGETVPSNGLYYDIICLEEGNTTPIITSSFRDVEAEQYVTFAIPYAVYDPQSLTATVKLVANGTELKTLTVDRTTQTWSYRPDDSGELQLSIVCTGASGETATKPFTLTVAESQIDVDVTTDDLALYLTSYGRSNNEDDPDTWSSGDIEVQFSGFNHKTDGWQTDDDGVTVMRLSGDARLTIPYQIFANDFRTSGKTIELEFATRDVLNYDAVLFSCMSGGKGLEVTAQRATLTSEQSSIGTQYKEEEHVRLSFVIEKKSSTKLLLCYINGILSGSMQYPDDDDFSQATPVSISIGSSDCTTDIYNIRIYDNDLTRYQILDNWIGDTQNGAERKARYERNNVYDDYGAITPDTLKKDLPYMVIVCPALPVDKEDENKVCSGYYVDPTDHTKDFTFENASIKVQGTSSQYYYIKNFKLKFKNGFTLYDGNASETYKLKSDSIPTDTFTFKADVASSEGANNVVLAQIYNDLCPVQTPPQETDPRVRQTIDGHPIAMFWDNGSETKFYAKMNFNNDKGTEEVFGFFEGDESWEILQNGTERTGFRSADFSGDDWKNDFEARYPEDNVNTANLAAFSAWLVSTNAAAATGETLSPAVTYDGVEYTIDSADYRRAKFKAEAHDHMDVDAMVYYYVITEMFLCIDQREKNAFPTRWKADPKHWMMLFYDADSSLGIDNKGKLAFDYYLEDIDYTEAGDPVFNGQASVLWVNLRECFYDKIMAEYKRLRTTTRTDGSGNPLLSYDVVNGLFEAHQSKWSEAIYNEDGYRKSIEPYALNGDTLYLPMLQGKKEQQRKWWLYNRFRYLDSKYNTGSSMETRITIRAHAQANIKLMSYVNMYGHVYYNAEMAEHRMRRGQEYEFEWAATGAEDAVIGINDADMLTSLGDLSPLMVELIDISKATHLTSLKVGDAAEGYVNNNLNSITLGNNVLLKTMDFRNCASLTQAVNASGCTGLEEAYFDGTAITGLSLPNGGALKKLHLPGTVTNLTLRNQSKLEEFVLPSYSQITTLWLENNSSAVDVFEILSAIPANSRVRLIGINQSVDTYADFEHVMTTLNSMRGLDENGNNVDTAQVSGTVHIGSLTSKELYEITSRYPSITVTYDTLVTYTVRFWNGDTLLQTVEGVKYMDTAEYTTEEPTKEGNFTFTGWSPEPIGVTGDMDCYAQFKFNGSYARALVQRTIEGDYENARVTSVGENAFRGCSELTAVTMDKATNVGEYAFNRCSDLTDVSMSEVTEIGNYAFYENYHIANIDFPKVSTVGDWAFTSEDLKELVLPETITTLGAGAFGFCCLSKIVIPSSLTSLGDRAWERSLVKTAGPIGSGCDVEFGWVEELPANGLYGMPLENIILPPGLKRIGANNFYGSQFSELVIPETVTNVGGYAFNSTSIVELYIPDTVTMFASYRTLYNNIYLKKVRLPVSATRFDDWFFWNCVVLETIILPSTKLATLNSTNAFDNTPVASGTGYIYVPRALIEDYKVATNWSTFANQFRAIEDYPEICGGEA